MLISGILRYISCHLHQTSFLTGVTSEAMEPDLGAGTGIEGGTFISIELPDRPAKCTGQRFGCVELEALFVYFSHQT